MKALFVSLTVSVVGFALVEKVQAVEAAKYAEKVIYSFCSQENCADGARPYAGLIDVNGTLYGTASDRGAGDCTGGCGALFSLDPGAGTETLLYSFAGGTDGAFPLAGLIDVEGVLYGTTTFAGNSNSACYPEGCGTLFSFDLKTGKETILYDFCSQANCEDGQTPEAGLVDFKGLLYGTTGFGGVNGPTRQGGQQACTGSSCGTVFSFDPRTNIEKVLHSFAGKSDGAYPVAGLISVGGRLYGTTSGDDMYSYGTVFAIDSSTGAESVLHSFCSQDNCADGDYPLASLIDVKGVLYGTTNLGGGTGCGGGGCGTVFSVTTSGVEKVIHAFSGGSDGESPHAALLAVNDILYGTTGGGANDWGTVFAIRRKTGKESVLYSFQARPDGEQSTANLIYANGALYGTTYAGGSGDGCGGYGCGAFFALTKNR